MPAGAEMRTDEMDVARGLIESLVNLAEGGGSALQIVTDPLPRLLRADKVAAFGVSLDAEPATLAFAYGSPCLVEKGTGRLATLIREHPRDFGAFDTASPPPAQRNVAVTRSEISAWASVSGLPAAREVFPAYGLEGLDFIRALVCDGAELLAWVGAFRREPFSDRERQLLGHILPALRGRLLVERQLGLTRVAIAALAAALDVMGAPAFVVRPPTNVVHANYAGRILRDRDARALEEELRAALAGDGSKYHVSSLTSRGAPDHFIVLQRAPRETAAERAAAAAAHWALTPRQREVLAHVIAGECDKTIAAKLGCAERTVELHVSACLERARCHQRAELVARAWSGA